MMTEMCNFRKHIDTLKYSPVLWLKHAHMNTHKHSIQDLRDQGAHSSCWCNMACRQWSLVLCENGVHLIRLRVGVSIRVYTASVIWRSGLSVSSLRPWRQAVVRTTLTPVLMWGDPDPEGLGHIGVMKVWLDWLPRLPALFGRIPKHHKCIAHWFLCSAP
jgi:hypothetical protein